MNPIKFVNDPALHCMCMYTSSSARCHILQSNRMCSRTDTVCMAFWPSPPHQVMNTYRYILYTYVCAHTLVHVHVTCMSCVSTLFTYFQVKMRLLAALNSQKSFILCNIDVYITSLLSFWVSIQSFSHQSLPEEARRAKCCKVF